LEVCNHPFHIYVPFTPKETYIYIPSSYPSYYREAWATKKREREKSKKLYSSKKRERIR
jgi:hypothetical protein